MKKFITASIFLAISLNAQTLATVNNQEIKVEDVNNFLKSTDQNMDYNKLDNKAKNLTLHQKMKTEAVYTETVSRKSKGKRQSIRWQNYKI